MNRLTEYITGIFSKANPAQSIISTEEGQNISTDQPYSISQAYKNFEVVQNGVGMVVSACCEFNIDIRDIKLSEGISGLRKAKLEQLLNHKPNPYQDIQTFRSQIFMDFVLEGNIFMYWDGVYLYHLPASSVIVVPDDKAYIKEYTYQNRTTFKPTEIIHIQDPGNESIYRGTSRLMSATRSLSILNKMRDFQENFFQNGCVPGLVLETENTLSQPAKQRTIEQWMKTYNPKNGAKKPMIIDSGLKLKAVSDAKFTDLDFEESTASYERKVLKALGIPPILMDGGNNANIAPNLRLFYLETVLPIVRRYTSALESFFGFDLEPITGTVSALQPELKEIAAFHSTLVNAGILTPNVDGGNNANIAPNLRLFYLETVLPIVRRYTSALESFFGFDLEPITGTVSALQPELKEIAAFHSTLVNAGILTPNEARVELRYKELPGKESTDIRIPANIAGSAANPSEGGKPPKDTTSQE